MAKHAVSIHWSRGEQNFTDNRYSRVHHWHFDGGQRIEASSSPHVVPVPFSDPAAVDPEQAFIASLSSCHMLWFLSLAAERGLIVDHYVDDATGTLARNAQGRLAITDVLLRPAVRFSGDRQPDFDELQALHHAAHDACFLASSVNCPVRCEARLDEALQRPAG